MKQAINYLSLAQEKNGSFLNQFSSDPQNFSNKSSYHTTFTTSLILSALCSLKDSPQLKIIKQKAVKFLLSQRSKHWSWNYWSRDSKETKTMPYPDDLDDTFAALNALFLYDKKIIDGEALANIVNLLTALEVKEGGPYRTWLVNKNAKKIWRDVDLAVNSNIGYFLALNEIDLPKLTSFIDSRIKKLDFSSPYYPSSFPIIYFISRFYNGRFKEKLIKHLLSKQQENGSFGNPLQTALAVSSLLNLDFDHKKLKLGIKYLLRNQINKHWVPYAFWLDSGIKEKKHFAGSEALTTAFCLEVLEKYQNASAKQNITEDNSQLSKQEIIYQAILQHVEKKLYSFDNSFKKSALELIAKLTKSNTDKQILLLPYYFAQSLGKKSSKIFDKVLMQLGAANLFGWIAYTLYDNFLDDEGDPKTLSLANVALRESFTLFSGILPNNKNYQIFLQYVFDLIDKANYWEVKNCRNRYKLPNYGNYEKLAEKSLGHSLGPLAILFLIGFDKRSKDFKQLITFFKNYLISRQLNDDAHDWEKDLKMGHINPTATLLLQKSSKKISITRLRKLFWEKILDEISLIILGHVKKGKLALSKCSVIANKSFFENMLIKYEKVALKALEEKKQTIKFLKTYKNE